MMEYWNDGLLDKRDGAGDYSSIPSFHYSNIPSSIPSDIDWTK